jgi:hypothetical protein
MRDACPTLRGAGALAALALLCGVPTHGRTDLQIGSPFSHCQGSHWPAYEIPARDGPRNLSQVSVC